MAVNDKIINLYLLYMSLFLGSYLFDSDDYNSGSGTEIEVNFSDSSESSKLNLDRFNYNLNPGSWSTNSPYNKDNTYFAAYNGYYSFNCNGIAQDRGSYWLSDNLTGTDAAISGGEDMSLMWINTLGTIQPANTIQFLLQRLIQIMMDFKLQQLLKLGL